MSGSAAGGAAWIQTASTLVLLGVAGHCAARLVQAGRAAARPQAARHTADLLMALGLAAMLWPPGDPIPPWQARSRSVLSSRGLWSSG